jgi:hypothetical protein
MDKGVEPRSRPARQEGEDAREVAVAVGLGSGSISRRTGVGHWYCSGSQGASRAPKMRCSSWFSCGHLRRARARARVRAFTKRRQWEEGRRKWMKKIAT